MPFSQPLPSLQLRWADQHSALGASSTFGPDPAQTPGLSYGHIAPVGAYDEPNRRVLVMDPDRAWYEPYWIPDDVALAGMATRDPVSGAPRGYLIVSVCEGACASGRLESDPGRMMRSTGVPPGPAASGKKLRWLTGSTATEWAPSAG